MLIPCLSVFSCVILCIVHFGVNKDIPLSLNKHRPYFPDGEVSFLFSRNVRVNFSYLNELRKTQDVFAVQFIFFSEVNVEFFQSRNIEIDVNVYLGLSFLKSKYGRYFQLRGLWIIQPTEEILNTFYQQNKNFRPLKLRKILQHN